MLHNNLKSDSAKKKKDRIERARATRKAYWYKKKLSKEVNDNGVKIREIKLFFFPQNIGKCLLIYLI